MLDADRINRLNKAIADIYSTSNEANNEDDPTTSDYIAFLLSCVMSFDEKARYQSGENISDIISH
jgi:hypothetical protein